MQSPSRTERREPTSCCSLLFLPMLDLSEHHPISGLADYYTINRFKNKENPWASQKINEEENCDLHQRSADGATAAVAGSTKPLLERNNSQIQSKINQMNLPWILFSIDVKSTTTSVDGLMTNISTELTNIRQSCARKNTIHLHPFVASQVGNLVQKIV